MYRLEVNVAGAKEVVTQLIIRYEWQLLIQTNRQTELANQSVSRLVLPLISYWVSQTVLQSVSPSGSQSVSQTVNKSVSLTSLRQRVIQSSSQLVCLSVSHPSGQPGSQTESHWATVSYVTFRPCSALFFVRLIVWFSIHPWSIYSPLDRWFLSFSSHYLPFNILDQFWIRLE